MTPLRKQIVDTKREPYFTSDNMLTRENEMKKKAADHARIRYEQKIKRLKYEKNERTERLAKLTKAIKSSYVTSATNIFKKKQSELHWNMK